MEIVSHIAFYEVKNQVSQIHYTEKLISNGNISFIPLKKTIVLEKYNVKSKISNQILSDVKDLHGISYGELVKTSMENEMKILREKMIYNTMFSLGEKNTVEDFSKFISLMNKWFGYTTKTKIQDDSEIFYNILERSGKILKKTRTSGANFIIVSHSIGERLKKLPQFMYKDPNSPFYDNNTSLINKIGSLGGIYTIFVNLNLGKDDSSILIGSNTENSDHGVYQLIDSLNFQTFNEESTKDQTIILSQKICTTSIGNSAHKKYYVMEITNKRYGLINYLFQKLFKK